MLNFSKKEFDLIMANIKNTLIHKEEKEVMRFVLPEFYKTPNKRFVLLVEPFCKDDDNNIMRKVIIGKENDGSTTCIFLNGGTINYQSLYGNLNYKPCLKFVKLIS